MLLSTCMQPHPATPPEQQAAAAAAIQHATESAATNRAHPLNQILLSDQAPAQRPAPRQPRQRQLVQQEPASLRQRLGHHQQSPSGSGGVEQHARSGQHSLDIPRQWQVVRSMKCVEADLSACRSVASSWTSSHVLVGGLQVTQAQQRQLEQVEADPSAHDFQQLRLLRLRSASAPAGSLSMEFWPAFDPEPHMPGAESAGAQSAGMALLAAASQHPHQQQQQQQQQISIADAARRRDQDGLPTASPTHGGDGAADGPNDQIADMEEGPQLPQPARSIPVPVSPVGEPARLLPSLV